MKKILLTLLFLIIYEVPALASKVNLYSVDVDLENFASIQKGAKHYVTYCLSCHSLKHMRYKRIAMDLNIPEALVLSEITPKGIGIYESMLTSMDKYDSKKLFGVVPPDLSLIARSRGADWLYTYLKGFYTDASKPFGVNNTVYKDVGMPNVLWKLQGIQKPIMQKVHKQDIIKFLKIVESGTLSNKQFDLFVTELVNFMVYVGEPIQLERLRIGKYVLLFLLVFTVIAYLLKKEYWKDVNHDNLDKLP